MSCTGSGPAQTRTESEPSCTEQSEAPAENKTSSSKGLVRSTFGMHFVRSSDVAKNAQCMLVGRPEQQPESNPVVDLGKTGTSFEMRRGCGDEEGVGLGGADAGRASQGPQVAQGGSCLEDLEGQPERAPAGEPAHDGGISPPNTGRKLRRGTFEIDAHPYGLGQGLGRIRYMGKEAKAQPSGVAAAASVQAGAESEDEARAILRVEHMLANQTSGLQSQTQESLHHKAPLHNAEYLTTSLGIRVVKPESLVEECTEEGSKLFSSQFRGVVAQPHGKWGAQIYDKHTRLWLGTYDSEMEAARAHDRAAVKIRGVDAMTNFRPLTADDREGAFIAMVDRDQLIEMLRKHTFDEEMAYCMRFGEAAGAHSEPFQPFQDQFRKRQFLFEKVLTPSDVGKLNRLVFPKHYAERFFPLDLEQASVGQTLQFEDESGKFWRFRYSYWNSSQSYVLTKGWSRFVKEKSLLPGDTVFFQKGHVGQLYIGYTRTQSVEGGASLPLPTPSEGHTTFSRPPEPSPYHRFRCQLEGSAFLGASLRAPSSGLRLFGVTLSEPPGEGVLQHTVRTGSLPTEASPSHPKRRFAEAFEAGAAEEGGVEQGHTVRRVASEGQARIMGDFLAPGGSETLRNERSEWGKTLRNGFLEGPVKLELHSGPEPISTAPETSMSGFDDTDGLGADLGLSVGPREVRPRVKCFVEGSPYGVVVDLSQYQSTTHLRNALLEATGGRDVVYEDSERDMVLLGDEDWVHFGRSVSRIFIRK